MVRVLAKKKKRKKEKEGNALQLKRQRRWETVDTSTVPFQNTLYNTLHAFAQGVVKVLKFQIFSNEKQEQKKAFRIPLLLLLIFICDNLHDKRRGSIL